VASISTLDGCVVVVMVVLVCSDFRRFGYEVRKNGSINTPVVVVCSLVGTIMLNAALLLASCQTEEKVYTRHPNHITRVRRPHHQSIETT